MESARCFAILSGQSHARVSRDAGDQPANSLDIPQSFAPEHPLKVADTCPEKQVHEALRASSWISGF